MSSPRFLADEDLRGDIVRSTRRMTPKVQFSTIVQLGLSGITDEQVIEYAWQEHWLLVSHDVNTMKAFAEHRIAAGDGLHGLFLVPQTRATRPIAECLSLIWSASEFEEWRDRIVYLPF